jgi:hypothetical protein
MSRGKSSHKLFRCSVQSYPPDRQPSAGDDARPWRVSSDNPTTHTSPRGHSFGHPYGCGCSFPIEPRSAPQDLVSVVGWALVAVLMSSILFGLASVLQPSAPNSMESSFILRSYSHFFLLQARWLSAPDWMPPGRGGVLDPSRCNRGSPLPRAPLWFVTKTDGSSAGTVVNGNGLYDVP